MYLLDIIISILTLVTLASGLYFGIRRFGLMREKFAFLSINVDVEVIKQVDDLFLVSIMVHLENKGQTRISARKGREGKECLYKDKWDKFKYAGTLKIRPAPPDKRQAEVFDWYSLKPMDILITKDNKEAKDDAEQINYLDDCEDPESKFQEVDFWLEPNEVYHQQVMVWLPSGAYAVKACFLGKMTQHGNEDYWSCNKLFNIKSL
jgi:hypothetical protein